MPISIKQIEAFAAVADLKSFRRAADRLNTTQPNISTRIAALEARFGFSLMDRTAGTVRLTARGAALLPKARAVLRELDGFVAAAGDDALFEGTLRLGVTEMVAHVWLGAFLKAFGDRFPNVAVEIDVDMSVEVSAALLDHSLDLALQNGPFSRDVTGMVPLGAHPMVWVAAPGLGVGSRKVTSADFAALPIIAHAKGSATYEGLLRHVAALGGETARIATSTNISACQRMAIDGLGATYLPRPMVEEDLAEGRLHLLDYEWAPEDLKFWARYHAESAPSYVAEAAGIAAEIAGNFGR